ncbi:hypothetical protein CK203_111145 [Vitis vinifera]|uniref:RNase H type-1 domain-containing protein n=1 Tax=Vitis vinifera TaxID=29760 RepID=A0A438EP32_VITVI|nr:hypothetical protein CK203_111145 [Vitis vinifera]
MTNQVKKWWTLRVDGASRSSGSGVGLLLQSPTGEHLEQAIRLGFPASNNEAEYEAILSGLDLALALSVSKLRIYSDSQLVVKHVQEEYEAKDARMARYLAKVRNTLQQFTEWTIEKIKRADNRRADALAGIAASLPIKEAILLPIHVQTNPSVSEISTAIPLRHPKRTTRMDDDLWHIGSFARILLANNEERRGSICQKCDKCQRYAPIPHMPSTTLKSISGPWPFAQWGMDIVGPLPAAPAQKKFLLVATDYFSKWVEAESYCHKMLQMTLPMAYIGGEGLIWPRHQASEHPSTCKGFLEIIKLPFFKELPTKLLSFRVASVLAEQAKHWGSRLT